MVQSWSVSTVSYKGYHVNFTSYGAWENGLVLVHVTIRWTSSFLATEDIKWMAVTVSYGDHHYLDHKNEGCAKDMNNSNESGCIVTKG